MLIWRRGTLIVPCFEESLRLCKVGFGFGFVAHRGLFVRVGGFGIFEDIDEVFALYVIVSMKRTKTK